MKVAQPLVTQILLDKVDGLTRPDNNMPANGQKAVSDQFSNFFGGGFDQKLNSFNPAAKGVRGGDADAQEGGFYGNAPPTAADAPT